MTKNILHIMGMDSTKYGGIERFNVELSKQLSKNGYHSVFVYERFPDVQQFVNDLRNTGAELVVINSRKNILHFCKELWKLLKEYDFCTVHAHFTKARFYALPLAILYGIKNILYTIHSTMQPLENIKYHTRLWYHLMNKKCRVVAVSEQIKSVCQKNWPDTTIKTIYMGVSPIQGNKESARKELNIKNDTIVITTTSNFNHVKGLDILCHAIKHLVDNKKMDNAIVYIVGQPQNDIDELNKIIHELSIESYIKMEGIKNNIPTYLNAADIYVQASRHEGLPLALMEATATSLPIVASKVGGIPEVAKENINALLVPPENPIELANALEVLMDNNELRNQFGEQSMIIYKSQFSIVENASKLIEFYNL